MMDEGLMRAPPGRGQEGKREGCHAQRQLGMATG